MEEIESTKVFYSAWNELPAGQTIEDIHEFERYYYDQPIRTWLETQLPKAEEFRDNVNMVRARDGWQKPRVILKKRTAYYTEWETLPGQEVYEQLSLF